MNKRKSMTLLASLVGVLYPAGRPGSSTDESPASSNFVPVETLGRTSSMPIKRLSSHISDCLAYFVSVTRLSDCISGLTGYLGFSSAPSILPKRPQALSFTIAQDKR